MHRKTTSPTQLLERIETEARQLGSEPMIRLANAIAEWRAGMVNSIDRGLGLVQHGGSSPRRADKLAERDDLIRGFAADYLSGLSVNAKAVAIATEMRLFARLEWPTLIGRTMAPPHLKPRQKILFRLFQLDGAPITDRQIRRVIGH